MPDGALRLCGAGGSAPGRAPLPSGSCQDAPAVRCPLAGKVKFKYVVKGNLSDFIIYHSLRIFPIVLLVSFTDSYPNQ